MQLPTPLPQATPPTTAAVPGAPTASHGLARPVPRPSDAARQPQSAHPPQCCCYTWQDHPAWNRRRSGRATGTRCVFCGATRPLVPSCCELLHPLVDGVTSRTLHAGGHTAVSAIECSTLGDKAQQQHGGNLNSDCGGTERCLAESSQSVTRAQWANRCMLGVN